VTLGSGAVRQGAASGSLALDRALRPQLGWLAIRRGFTKTKTAAIREINENGVGEDWDWQGIALVSVERQPGARADPLQIRGAWVAPIATGSQCGCKRRTSPNIFGQS